MSHSAFVNPHQNHMQCGRWGKLVMSSGVMSQWSEVHLVLGRGAVMNRKQSWKRGKLLRKASCPCQPLSRPSAFVFMAPQKPTSPTGELLLLLAARIPSLVVLMLGAG